MENPDQWLEKYREELISLLHKSQDSFEKQLSYISAGSLALSIGFIKDVVKLPTADCKCLLSIGWILLGLTLLLNCISHIWAATLHARTIDEMNNDKYDADKIRGRYKSMTNLNWGTIATMVVGIILIIVFVIININNE